MRGQENQSCPTRNDGAGQIKDVEVWPTLHKEESLLFPEPTLGRRVRGSLFLDLALGYPLRTRVCAMPHNHGQTCGLAAKSWASNPVARCAELFAPLRAYVAAGRGTPHTPCCSDAKHPDSGKPLLLHSRLCAAAQQRRHQRGLVPLPAPMTTDRAGRGRPSTRRCMRASWPVANRRALRSSMGGMGWRIAWWVIVAMHLMQGLVRRPSQRMHL